MISTAGSGLEKKSAIQAEVKREEEIARLFAGARALKCHDSTIAADNVGIFEWNERGEEGRGRAREDKMNSQRLQTK
jgi:hypothetical protein